MKKFATVAAGAALAVSMLGFTACGNSSEGKNKDNYTTPTREEFSAAISSIDTDKAFSDENSTPSFEILSKISTDITMGSEYANAELNLGYKLAFGEKDFLGSGTVAVNSESKTGGTEIKQKYAATLFNDAEWAYAEIAKIPSVPSKYKIELGKLMPPTVNTLDGDADLTEFFTTCETYKIQLGLNTSDGVKIKLSLTEETLWAILADADITEETIAQVKEIVTFNTFRLDMYLAFDKTGLFSQASIDMNIDIKINGDALEDILGQIPEYTPGAISGDISIKLKGYLMVKTYDGTITLPEGIESDDTYIDITDSLGSIIG
ncbi:MAG: hypothetical protein K2L12_05255 [Clostridia bacterium]|nr:hypothetical protein [Clostridia bacterium]